MDAIDKKTEQKKKNENEIKPQIELTIKGESKTAIKKKLEGCEVLLVFNEHNSELKNKVLWLLLEDYQARILDEIRNN